MTGPFTRGCGVALCAAAVITLGLNVFVTPLLPDGDFTRIAASNAYLVRQCLAAAVAMLLVFGAVGIQVSRVRTGLFGGIAAVLAIAGSVCLFEIEYSQLSAFHSFAVNAPAALTQVMEARGSSLQFGTFLAVIAFFAGWFALALSLLLSGQYARVAPALVMIGLLLPMLLGALGLATPWPAIASSLFTGGGWFLIGLRMVQARGQGAS